jgi:hypothetical protein
MGTEQLHHRILTPKFSEMPCVPLAPCTASAFRYSSICSGVIPSPLSTTHSLYWPVRFKLSQSTSQMIAPSEISPAARQR